MTTCNELSLVLQVFEIIVNALKFPLEQKSWHDLLLARSPHLLSNPHFSMRARNVFSISLNRDKNSGLSFIHYRSRKFHKINN